MKSKPQTNRAEKVTVLYYNTTGESSESPGSAQEYNPHFIGKGLSQDTFISLISQSESDLVLIMDTDRLPLSGVGTLLNAYHKSKDINGIYYVTDKTPRTFFKYISRSWGGADKTIINSAAFIGEKRFFLKAYAGEDLCEDPLAAIGYSLQKNYVTLRKAEVSVPERKISVPKNHPAFFFNFHFKLPFQYLVSGQFFTHFFDAGEKGKRDMSYRFLMSLFALFICCYMPCISLDYGISADEFIDNTQSGHVIHYFTNGDKAALNQPKTMLHLYGLSIQVVITAVARLFNIDDIYTFRHIACSLTGAWGIWIVGLLGLRFGSGLCGLLSILLMFFTPRYFGHSMNNLKDIPFAVGYVAAIYYFIRLFDHYPYFKPSCIAGAVAGFFLALGTRSGGLMLFPYLIMYGGLFYIMTVGVKEFYKFSKHREDFSRILWIIVLVIVAGYLVSIALWPFALQKPLTNVTLSLKLFTNINTGLRTIFNGEQMMSNMLPNSYAPKYLMIGMPVVTLLGFAGYLIYSCVRRKEFSLIAYFLLFASIFPVFWVVYQKSNLYGGIRHLLFVMPVMVVIAGKFWTIAVLSVKKQMKFIVLVLFFALLSLPGIHMFRNHPNDYIYFNEFAGGLKGAYGNYDTDYFFNSIKNSAEWFRKNVSKPEDRKTIIVTNYGAGVSEYFKADTNVKVIYSRYYEKHAKDWDYAIWGNMYINRFQLQNGLFPPPGCIYSSKVDGFPMSVVIRRDTKEELAGCLLERQGKYAEALAVFEKYIEKHPLNEEILSKMAKICYTLNDLPRAELLGKQALKLHPSLNEALYVQTLVYLQMNKPKEAMEAAQAILDENKFSPDGYYLKALVYDKTKNHKEAIDNINIVLSYRPQHEGALKLAGDILSTNGNYKSAADVYKKLLAVKNTPANKTALANCYCRLQEYGQVDALWQEIQKEIPGYFPMYKVVLRMLLQQKNLPAARTVLQQTAGINNDSELFVLRAWYENEHHNSGNALSMLDEALKLKPENAEALKLKKSLTTTFGK